MAVATQGMRGSLHWVTQYKVLFSDDEKNWKPITEKNGEPKVVDRGVPVVELGLEIARVQDL
jgi:hypothetical protein